MFDQEAPKNLPKSIILIILHHTSQASCLPYSDLGKLDKVIVDGVERKPKKSNPNVAWNWLQANDYTIGEFRWLDSPGFVRRRWMEYSHD